MKLFFLFISSIFIINIFSITVNAEIKLTKNHKKAISYECKTSQKKNFDSRAQCKRFLTLALKKEGVLFDLDDFNENKIEKVELSCSGRIKKGAKVYNNCLASLLDVEIIIEIPPVVKQPGESGKKEKDPIVIATADDVYKKVLPATYFVYAHDNNDKMGVQGTAVGIRKNYFATNCHVLFNKKQNRWWKQLEMIHVNMDFRKTVNWKIMTLFKDDRDSDRCIIFNNKINNGIVTIKKINEIKMDEKVFAVGNPEGHPGVLTKGVVQRIYKPYSEPYLFPIEVIQTDAHIRHGNSGGGLYDLEANLIGITTFGQKKQKDGDDSYRETNPFNFAIAAERFNDFFK